MKDKCPYLNTGFNGEYRCDAVKDSRGYYSNTYLGDSPNKECLGDYIKCDKFKSAYAKKVRE